MPPIGEKIRFVSETEAEEKRLRLELLVQHKEHRVISIMRRLTNPDENPHSKDSNGYSFVSKVVLYTLEGLEPSQEIQAWCSRQEDADEIKLFTSVWTHGRSLTMRTSPAQRVIADPSANTLDYQFTEDPEHDWTADDKLIALGNILDTLQLIDDQN